MDAQRNRFTHRRAVMGGVKTLVVKAVADFVKNAEEGVGEMMGVVPCCDPRVARADACAERMLGRIEPAAFEIKTHARRGGFTENALAVDGKLAMEDRRVGLSTRHRDRVTSATSSGRRASNKVASSWQFAPGSYSSSKALYNSPPLDRQRAPHA